MCTCSIVHKIKHSHTLIGTWTLLKSGTLGSDMGLDVTARTTFLMNKQFRIGTCLLVVKSLSYWLSREADVSVYHTYPKPPAIWQFHCSLLRCKAVVWKTAEDNRTPLGPAPGAVGSSKSSEVRKRKVRTRSQLGGGRITRPSEGAPSHCSRASGRGVHVRKGLNVQACVVFHTHPRSIEGCAEANT